MCIKFCIKLEHFSARTIQMIQKSFEDDAMSAAQMKVWHKHFKCGQESAESDPCSERPATRGIPEKSKVVWAEINKDW